tara:strand:- start:192 stop:380 length:189 start_codon:yes stop_codon:yes gene_type:complete
MYYHPLIGVSIFLVTIILSFILGRHFVKNKKSKLTNLYKTEQNHVPKGEVTSPDAPWLKKNK